MSDETPVVPADVAAAPVAVAPVAVVVAAPVAAAPAAPAAPVVDTDKLLAMLEALGHDFEGKWSHLIALATKL